jgi:hypothetical protein
MRKSLLAFAASGVVTSFTHATVICTSVPRSTPRGSGGAPIASGYSGYTIRLVETTGANITAVDMESGTHGMFGRFVQRWTSSAGDGVYDTKTINVTGNNENLTNSVINFDSHLLQPGNPKADPNYVGKINFDENPSVPFAPSGTPVPPFGTNSDSAGFSLGSDSGYIKAAFGINGPAQSSVLDLAYIVVPDGYYSNPTLPQFGIGTALVAVAGASPQLVQLVIIPEPAFTFVLSSALQLLARRRRV